MMEMNLLCSKKTFFNLLDVSNIDKRVGVAEKKNLFNILYVEKLFYCIFSLLLLFLLHAHFCT